MYNYTYNDILSSYERKDFESLFGSIHSFKGVVGNLGLSSLYDISNVITKATRSLKEVNIDKEINELRKRYSFVEDTYRNK